jgi:hypothetical protein
MVANFKSEAMVDAKAKEMVLEMRKLTVRLVEHSTGTVGDGDDDNRAFSGEPE